MKKISVIVVDDSALIRQLLSDILNADAEIEVVAIAADPYQAREKIKIFNPDVLTLDVEMPRMDGVTFLRNLMRLRPMPVVMVSALTEHGAQVTLEALELGAFDFVAKPKLDLSHTFADYAEEIIAKVKAAAVVNVSALERRPGPGAAEKLSVETVLAPQAGKATRLKMTEKVIAMGASTGGSEAIKQVLCALPADAPAIVITQHIPVAFSAAFAKRVDGLASIQVRQAEEGEQILPGHAYIAPGDRHLLVERSGACYYCRLNDGPPVSRHKPSVDVLFRSVAQHVGPNAVGIMLTGMGSDGARGMLEMRQAGAFNLAQDEKTSVVWGMPGAAIKAGATEKVLPLQGIAAEIMALSR
ncbi:protein-glutamate methylesterase/protein-glutamine glutaminase [Methylophaga sp. OBS4]|uniref:protein-glutamate methylesterase/protein-glutamine glutaminase n=1 Tax=Methylophaga sp. OBS4 TaxID=2991935 RepID=UPI002258712F|nr:chemotaxis response regulator protein-glutamate methylesterase [Methylophaga sp. OBS4]MCX4187393.1 chemotaxis response regulator protein-glutamate methylesterase [Methylophaga sp. OBS4]